MAVAAHARFMIEFLGAFSEPWHHDCNGAQWRALNSRMRLKNAATVLDRLNSFHVQSPVKSFNPGRPC